MAQELSAVPSGQMGPLVRFVARHVSALAVLPDSASTVNPAYEVLASILEVLRIDLMLAHAIADALESLLYGALAVPLRNLLARVREAATFRACRDTNNMGEGVPGSSSIAEHALEETRSRDRRLLACLGMLLRLYVATIAAHSCCAALQPQIVVMPGQAASLDRGAYNTITSNQAAGPGLALGGFFEPLQEAGSCDVLPSLAHVLEYAASLAPADAAVSKAEVDSLVAPAQLVFINCAVVRLGLLQEQLQRVEHRCPIPSGRQLSPSEAGRPDVNGLMEEMAKLEAALANAAALVHARVTAASAEESPVVWDETAWDGVWSTLRATQLPEAFWVMLIDAAGTQARGIRTFWRTPHARLCFMQCLLASATAGTSLATQATCRGPSPPSNTQSCRLQHASLALLASPDFYELAPLSDSWPEAIAMELTRLAKRGASVQALSSAAMSLGGTTEENSMHGMQQNGGQVAGRSFISDENPPADQGTSGLHFSSWEALQRLDANGNLIHLISQSLDKLCAWTCNTPHCHLPVSRLGLPRTEMSEIELDSLHKVTLLLQLAHAVPREYFTGSEAARMSGLAWGVDACLGSALLSWHNAGLQPHNVTLAAWAAARQLLARHISLEHAVVPDMLSGSISISLAWLAQSAHYAEQNLAGPAQAGVMQIDSTLRQLRAWTKSCISGLCKIMLVQNVPGGPSEGPEGLHTTQILKWVHTLPVARLNTGENVSGDWDCYIGCIPT